MYLDTRCAERSAVVVLGSKNAGRLLTDHGDQNKRHFIILHQASEANEWRQHEEDGQQKRHDDGETHSV